jgi:hypothetical protein
MITQTNHAFDNAIDAIGDNYNLYAVCDMTVNAQEHDGRTPWFRGYADGMEIRYVHCNLLRTGFFKRGEHIGNYNVPNDPFPNHLHISVLKDGIWLNFMEYLDRSLNLKLSGGFTASQQFYKNWSTWADKSLNITNTANMNTVTVQAGWGLSHVAKAAGMSDWSSPSSWQRIFEMNKGHRGANSWQELNARMGAGDVLNVNAQAQVKPAVVVDPKIKELESKINELNSKHQEELRKAEELKKAEIEKIAQEKITEVNIINEDIQELEKNLEEKKQQILNLQNEVKEYETISNFNIGHKEQIDILENVVEETIEVDGILNRWGSFVDRTFKSKTLRSILKYDVFVLIGFTIPYAVLHLSEITNDTGIITAVSILLGVVSKLLTTRYDRNKDGKLDKSDMVIL